MPCILPACGLSSLPWYFAIIHRQNTTGPNAKLTNYPLQTHLIQTRFCSNKVFIPNITHHPLTQSHPNDFLLPPLALQLGEALAHIIHRHLEELVGKIPVVGVAGHGVQVVDEELPLCGLQKGRERVKGWRHDNTDVHLKKGFSNCEAIAV